MSQWYYTRNRQQNGPVSFEELQKIASTGDLAPADMVWNPPMPDWIPASSVQGLFSNSGNPYAAPATTFTEGLSAVAPQGEMLTEIEPGSQPIQIGACIERGFNLTKRNLGPIVLSALVFFVTNWVIGFVIGSVSGFSGGMQASTSVNQAEQTGPMMAVIIVLQIISQMATIFLTLGFTRIGLDFVSGKPISPGQLFSQGHKFLKAIGASLLYYLVVFLGLVLLIIPGIYLAIRFSFYLTAIVDRDLGVIDSFKYSAAITKNNILRLIGLGFLCGLISLVGILLCGVGILFAYPVSFIAWTVAYRWLQYGSQVTQDHPGTQQPVLKI